MAAQRQSNARPVHTKTTETCQSPKPINPSRQNSIVVPVAVDDLTYLDPCDEEAKKELNREAERRTLFQNVSNGILEIPNGYRKVEVLIIRWDESVDEFKDHKQEVRLPILQELLPDENGRSIGSRQFSQLASASDVP
jgi:hypothetical protein